MAPANILFLAEGQLGDLLLLTPALRAIKESFPAAVVSVLVVDRHKEYPGSPILISNESSTPLSGNPCVDTVHVVSRRALRSLHGFQRMVAEVSLVRFLRTNRYDTVICTFREDRFALWAFASSASLRVGERNQALRWMLNVAPDIDKSRQGVLEYYLDLVRAMGAKVQSNHTEYYVPDKSKRWADEFLRTQRLEPSVPLVEVHPGATGDYKIWPPANFAALIDRIQQDGARVILCQGTMDMPIVDAIKSHLRAEMIVAQTGDEIGNLAALFQRCALVITNDSGPRHLAIAVGAPSLALFRKHHDKQWGVYEEGALLRIIKSENACSACSVGDCLDRVPDGERFGSYCMRDISVENVEAVVKEMLQAVHQRATTGKG